MNGLGNKIARRRKDLGMTQTEFAEDLCVTRQTVSRWEAGSVMPDIDKIADLAKLLQVSCDYLLNDEIKEDETPSIHTDPVSRLLKDALGKKVRFTFFEDEADMDLWNTVCEIVSLEGGWMKVKAQTKKGDIEKLIPVSSVLSIAYEKPANKKSIVN
jgi:transcriptional regulator with XRE-family HTH domain